MMTGGGGGGGGVPPVLASHSHGYNMGEINVCVWGGGVDRQLKMSLDGRKQVRMERHEDKPQHLHWLK